MIKTISKTITEYEFDNAGRVIKETVTTESYEVEEEKSQIGYIASKSKKIEVNNKEKKL